MSIDETKDNLRSKLIDWNLESFHLVRSWYDESEYSKVISCIKSYRVNDSG